MAANEVTVKIDIKITANPLFIWVGKLLLTFECFEDWQNKGQSWCRSMNIKMQDTIWVDAQGRLVRSGREMKRAKETDAFPVRVFEMVI